jgi:membrane-associated HD superfamily phosphohydrolase
LRTSFRRKIDRALGADLVWSFVFVAGIMLLLAAQYWGRPYDELEVGQPAAADVRAREAFDYRDDAETLRRQLEARESVPDVYVHDVNWGVHLSRRLAAVFDDGRAAIEQAERRQESPAEAVDRAIAGRIPAATVRILLENGFDPALEREMTAALTDTMSTRVVSNKALLERAAKITLLRIPEERREVFENFDDFAELSEARDRVRRNLIERIDLSSRQEQALGDFVTSFVDANVHYDREATNRARQDAERGVPPVYQRMAQGALLVRKGEPVTPEQLTQLRFANQASRPEFGLAGMAGVLVIATLLAFFLFRYTRYHQRAFRKLDHLHALMVLMCSVGRSSVWPGRSSTT